MKTRERETQRMWVNMIGPVGPERKHQQDRESAAPQSQSVYKQCTEGPRRLHGELIKPHRSMQSQVGTVCLNETDIVTKTRQTHVDSSNFISAEPNLPVERVKILALMQPRQ